MPLKHIYQIPNMHPTIIQTTHPDDAQAFIWRSLFFCQMGINLRINLLPDKPNPMQQSMGSFDPLQSKPSLVKVAWTLAWDQWRQPIVLRIQQYSLWCTLPGREPVQQRTKPNSPFPLPISASSALQNSTPAQQDYLMADLAAALASHQTAVLAETHTRTKHRLGTITLNIAQNPDLVRTSSLMKCVKWT